MTRTRTGPPVALLSKILKDSEAAMATLALAGVDVVIDLEGYERDQAAFWSALPKIEALVVGLQPVDGDLLTAAPNLRYILRMGTGLDNVDLERCAVRGIQVEALPGRNADAVAELAFGLMLAAARDIPALDASIRAGNWSRRTGRQLSGRTLGLVGFGAIGRAMVPKAHGFGMRVVACQRSWSQPEVPGVRAVELNELLDVSHFVSLHVPLTPRTHHLIGRDEIRRMRQTVLVNTARGDVVDEDALIEGLRSGNVAACALDVFAHEPPVLSPLLTMDHVVLSPHNGAYGDQAVEEVAQAAVGRLLAGLGLVAPISKMSAGTGRSRR